MNKLLLLLVVSLSGCVSMEQMVEREGAKHNAPRWKIDAVKHGCISGRADGGDMYSRFIKDYDQYKTNPDYAMVYDDSYKTCRARYESTMRSYR